MKTDLFQSCGHCWVSQICWHIKCNTLTAFSFRIWNSSTGIPSRPLALFVVMLLKAHLTSRSRMSGSRWVITPSWLSRSWRSFLHGSSVYSCQLFLISSASFSALYWVHLCMKCSLGISNFLVAISSLSYSIAVTNGFTILPFPSLVATAEFSKFAGILNAELSRHHLSVFEVAQRESHRLLYAFIWTQNKLFFVYVFCYSSSHSKSWI